MHNQIHHQALPYSSVGSNKLLLKHAEFNIWQCLVSGGESSMRYSHQTKSIQQLMKSHTVHDVLCLKSFPQMADLSRVQQSSLNKLHPKQTILWDEWQST